MVDLIREPDGMGPPYECCCICGEGTPYWYSKKDVPLCEDCSKKITDEEIPTKEEWINK